MTTKAAHSDGGGRRAGGYVLGARACALVMTAVAGFVDIVGYILLAHLYVANMSGNSVAMGMYVTDGNWPEVVRRGYPVAVFVAGLLAGGVVAEVGRRRWGPGRAVRMTLLLEVALLAAFAGCGVAFGRDLSSTGKAGVLVTLGATAMGVQNVALRASGALSVYTTHVTGALTQLADEAVRYGLWVRQWTSGRGRGRWGRVMRASRRQPAFREVVFLVGLWVIYVLGAVVGAGLLSRFGVGRAMALPLALLVGVVVLGCRPAAARRLQHGHRSRE